MSEPWRARAYAFPALIGLGILNHTVLTGSRVTISLYALSLGSSAFVVGVPMGLYAFLPMLLVGAPPHGSYRRTKTHAGHSCGRAIAAALPCFVSGIALVRHHSLLGASFMLFQVVTQNATGMFVRARQALCDAGARLVSGCGPSSVG